jgi:hypothetical protein
MARPRIEAATGIALVARHPQGHTSRPEPREPHI